RLNQLRSIRNGSSEFFSNRDKPQSAVVENLGSDAFLFAQNAQQEVLGADMPVVQSLGFFIGASQDSLALTRQRQIDRSRNLLADRGPPFDLLSNALNGGRIPKKSVGQILVFTD